MKKFIFFLPLLLIFYFPSYSAATPEKSFNKIVKLIHKEDYVSAENLLDIFLHKHHDDIWYLRSLYLKGHINIKLSKLKDAVENFSILNSEYFQLQDYVQLKLSELFVELNEENKSFELLNRLIEEFPGSSLMSKSEFLLGKIYYNRGELDNALKYFKKIVHKYPKSDLVPESMFYIGLILEKQGKIINAYESYSKLFHSFPLNDFAIRAEEKIKEMKKAKTKLPGFSPEMISKRIELLMEAAQYHKAIRECLTYLKIFKKGPLYQNLTLKLGKTYNYLKKRKEALKVYNSFIKKYPSGSVAPEVLYKIANIYWNLGKYSKAIEFCKKTINKFPSSSYAERAFYVMGRINAQNKKYQKALTSFNQMANKYPHGAYVVSANWRIGWINYIIGNYQKAAEKFTNTASKFPKSPIRDMLLYWAGKSNEKIGRTKSAHKFYQQVAEEYPYDYYGHRGKTRLNKKLGKEVKIIDPFLQRELEADPVNSELIIKLNKKEHFHYEKIKELTVLGYYEDALKEIKLIAKNVSINTPQKIMQIGNLYLQIENYFKTIEIMEGFLHELSLKKQLNLAAGYWKLFFPLAYWDIVLNNAINYKLDPFFIIALMRQESIFDPNSLSKSNAMGLMQLIPETGKHEYKKKYGGEFDPEELYKPEINISLGSQHLAYLFNKTKGDPILTLSGYNAGLSRAIKWKKSLKTSDPDVFIEMIPFRETRWYIKKVLRNYFNYILLYSNGKEKDKILALNQTDLQQ